MAKVSPTTEYPEPANIHVAELAEVSPDQSYYFGWLVQHSRLWALNVALILAIFGLVAVIFIQTQRYQPSVSWVELRSGLPVMINPNGETEIDGVVYRPGPMLALVESFVQSRYAYRYDVLEASLNRSLGMMSQEGAALEQVKIRDARIGLRIANLNAVHRLQLDMGAVQVTPLGNGEFKVILPGQALVNDAQNYPDPSAPFRRRFEAEVTVVTVPATIENPYGYLISGTGNEPILQ